MIELILIGTSIYSFFINIILGICLLLMIFLYPIIYESFLKCIFTIIYIFSKSDKLPIITNYPIIYDKKYNIKLFGIEEDHSFDTLKS